MERRISSVNNQSLHPNSISQDYEIAHPLIYSLNHPLDDFCPVAIKSSTFRVLSSSAFKIIHMNLDPSICLVYDLSTNQHCVFLYRRLQHNEFSEISMSKSKMSTSLPSSISISQKVRQTLSFWSGHSAGLPLATGSPYSSKATSLSSLISPMGSRAHSPMAQISRCQSPCASPVFGGSGWHNRASNLHDDTLAGTQMDNSAMIKQTNPEYCFELIWSENTSKSNLSSGSGQASKAFLSTDMVGQKYLCYLLPHKLQLILVRMDLTNDNNLIFGTSYFLTAKDAVPIVDLNMIAILDASCHVMLFSGPTKIGKLHVGGVSAELSASPLIMRNIPSYFKSPYPRRSSLLPNACSSSVPKFDEHLLSPVAPIASGKESRNVFHSTMFGDPYMSGDSNNNLVGLRDPVADRITMQYSDNTFYRISLPRLASGTLVEDCLNALRQSLQRDVAMSLLCKWYTTRNAPGPIDLSIDQEFNIFSTLLFGKHFYF